MTLTEVKVTNASQTWQMLTCSLAVISRTLWHSNLAGRFTTMTLMQSCSGFADENFKCWIRPISTTKQAISIQLAAIVRHDKFYFSLKSYVAFVLNYGHTSVSCKTYVSSLANACFPSTLSASIRHWCTSLIHDVNKYFRVPRPPTCDGLSRGEMQEEFIYIYIYIIANTLAEPEL